MGNSTNRLGANIRPRELKGSTKHNDRTRSRQTAPGVDLKTVGPMVLTIMVDAELTTLNENDEEQHTASVWTTGTLQAWICGGSRGRGKLAKTMEQMLLDFSEGFRNKGVDTGAMHRSSGAGHQKWKYHG